MLNSTTRPPIIPCRPDVVVAPGTAVVLKMARATSGHVPAHGGCICDRPILSHILPLCPITSSIFVTVFESFRVQTKSVAFLLVLTIRINHLLHSLPIHSTPPHGDVTAFMRQQRRQYSVLHLLRTYQGLAVHMHPQITALFVLYKVWPEIFLTRRTFHLALFKLKFALP